LEREAECARHAQARSRIATDALFHLVALGAFEQQGFALSERRRLGARRWALLRRRIDQRAGAELRPGQVEVLHDLGVLRRLDGDLTCAAKA